MDMDDIEVALSDPRFPPSELARRAGVSRNTLWNLKRDPSRALISTLREIVLAEGLDVTVQTRPASSSSASAAARWRLGDLNDDTHDLQEWADRLARWVNTEDPLALVQAAAAVSCPQHRTGAVLLRGRSDPERLASAGFASERPWALSGAVGLDYLGVPGTTALPTVLWVYDPVDVRRLLGETHQETRSLGAANVIVAPADSRVLAGTAEVDRLPFVTPLQLVIDCVGVGGELGTLAMTLAKGW
jgi:transcriptional regulator with XRE-family HTH domain